MRLPIAFIALLSALAIAACGGDDVLPTPSESPSATTSPTTTASPRPSVTPIFSVTPTPSPVATPAPSPPAALSAYRIVYYKKVPDEWRYNPHGSLWAANADGTNARQISPDGIRAVFVSLFGSKLYYAESPSDSERVFYRFDLDTNEKDELFHIEDQAKDETYAAVSPDQRYVAFANGDSIDLRDLQSGPTRRLLQGNSPGCNPPFASGGCFGYRQPYWSPDGRWLAVQKTFYEGGHMVVIDPNNPVEQEMAPGKMDSAYFINWRRDSGAACLLGQYAAPSALYVAHSPNWESDEFFSEFQTHNSTESPSVAGCVWISNNELAITVMDFSNSNRWRLMTLDVTNGHTRTLFDNTSDEWSRVMFRLADSKYVVLTPIARDTTHSPPGLLDTETGAIYPVLGAGDIIAGGS